MKKSLKPAKLGDIVSAGKWRGRVIAIKPPLFDRPGFEPRYVIAFTSKGNVSHNTPEPTSVPTHVLTEPTYTLYRGEFNVISEMGFILNQYGQ
jgi:hypothetical protein